MINSRLHILTIAILTLTIPILSARTVKTIFIQAPSNAPREVYLHTGKESLEAPLPRRNLSDEIKLPKGELILTILNKPLEKDQEIPKDAQQIKIPETWKKCILVFVPNKNGKNFPAKAKAINGASESFSMGSSLIYNLTKATFMGKFGPRTIVVKPNKSGLLKAPINEAGSYLVAMDCMLPGATTRSVITRSSWVHNPNARQILFIVPTPNQKVPRVWGVLDRSKDEVKK